MWPTYATRSDAVTQIVYLSAPNSAKADDSFCLDQKGLRWSKLKLALEYELDMDLEDQFMSGLFATCIPVRDAFLVLSRVTEWLDQLLKFFGSHIVSYDECGYEYRWERGIPEACARAMALDLRVCNLNIGCSSYY
jgi:hypothetical protein